MLHLRNLKSNCKKKFKILRLKDGAWNQSATANSISFIGVFFKNHYSFLIFGFPIFRFFPR